MQLHCKRPAVFGNEGCVAGCLLPSTRTAPDVFQKSSPILLDDVIQQRISNEHIAVGGQHHSAGKIDLLNVSILLQGDVPQRRESYRST